MKGERGDQGDRGTQGEHGDQGDRGARGVHGHMGDRGDQGQQGAPGGLTEDQYRSIRTLAICACVLFIVGLGWSTYVGYSNREDARTSQVAGCERGKLDRADNADFQQAYVRYNLAVTSAASVKQDVKIAARLLRKTVQRTSASLASRTGDLRVPESGFYAGKQIGLDCEAIPSPSLLP